MVFDGDRVYAKEAYGRTMPNSSWVRGRVTRDDRRGLFRYPRPMTKISEPCVLLGGDENYAHWLLRCVLRLSLIEGEPQLKQLPLLLNDDCLSFQREYLDLLEVSENRRRFLERDTVVDCAELYVATQFRGHPRVAEAVTWLRERLVSHLRPTGQAQRLFVSLADSTRRVLRNEAEIYERLRGSGFVRIVPGQMRVVDQMRAFAAADVVVAAQGAALSNIVFCRPGTRVISLARIEIKGVDVFTWLARELSLDLQNVVAAQLAPDESVSDPDSVRQDFEISPDAVEAALRAVDIV